MDERSTPAERIRAQAKEATRKALLEAGLAETIERGGEMPSVEAACKRAGYTRGAFYVYFEGRDQYVSELLDWVLSDIIQTLFVATTEGVTGLEEVVSRFTEAMAVGDWPDLHGDIRAAYLAVLRELHPEAPLGERHSELMGAIAARLEGLVRDGQEEGRFRRDVEAPQVAMLALLSAIGTIVWDDVGIPLENRALGEALVKLLEVPESSGPGP